MGRAGAFGFDSFGEQIPGGLEEDATLALALTGMNGILLAWNMVKRNSTDSALA